MDIPGIGGKKIPENPTSEETQDATTDATTSAGIAAEGDSLQNAEEAKGEYFRTGWGTETVPEYSAGLGVSEEKQSLIIGAVERVTVQSGGIVRIGYRDEDVNLAGKNVDIDMNITGSILYDRRGGYAMEASIGKETHIKIGFEMFQGLLLGLAGMFGLDDIFQIRLGVSGGVGVGGVANVNMGIEDGVYKADIQLGLGGGLAGIIDYGVSVNIPEFFDLMGHVAVAGAEATGEWLFDVGKATSAGTLALIGGIVSQQPETGQGVVDWIADSYDW